jgi:hypothetical protein
MARLQRAVLFLHQRIENEDQRQRDAEKTRAVERRVDGELRPVERIGPKAEGDDRGQPAEPAGHLAGRPAF